MKIKLDHAKNILDKITKRLNIPEMSDELYKDLLFIIMSRSDKTIKKPLSPETLIKASKEALSLK